MKRDDRICRKIEASLLSSILILSAIVNTIVETCCVSVMNECVYICTIDICICTEIIKIKMLYTFQR